MLWWGERSCGIRGPSTAGPLAAQQLLPLVQLRGRAAGCCCSLIGMSGPPDGVYDPS